MVLVVATIIGGQQLLVVKFDDLTIISVAKIGKPSLFSKSILIFDPTKDV